jgi:hypothetical protein
VSVRPPLNHVNLLGLLYALWGAITMLIGASTLALGIAAAALVGAAGRAGGAQIAAGLTAATFLTLAAITLAWGAAHLVVGRHLRRHSAWSRLAALMLGSADLVLIPYGTALGGYSLWTLLGEDAKRLFEA